MKFYVSRTHVSLESGKLTGYETVLTKPDALKPAREMLRRMRAIGIPNLHLCEHPTGSRRWGMLDREQTKRTKTRAMTIADVAADLAELEREAAEKEEADKS
jgi:hypothetical protein|tara:strand:+ start:2938 stop:3243 length:306 start_codon:yes stop_codon:yes gene_type:complete